MTDSNLHSQFNLEQERLRYLKSLWIYGYIVILCVSLIFAGVFQPQRTLIETVGLGLFVAGSTAALYTLIWILASLFWLILKRKEDMQYGVN